VVRMLNHVCASRRMVSPCPARRVGARAWVASRGPAGLDGASNRIEVVQLATGRVLQSHALPYGPSGVEFSPDGRELVGLGCCWTGSGSNLVAWDAHTGRQLFSPGSLDAESFPLQVSSRMRTATNREATRTVPSSARAAKRTGKRRVGSL